MKRDQAGTGIDEVCATGIPEPSGEGATHQFGSWMVCDAAEHVPEPYRGIDLNKFAGSNKASQDSRCPAAGIAPEERPVSASHREAPQRPFRAVVVDRQNSPLPH